MHLGCFAFGLNLNTASSVKQAKRERQPKRKRKEHTRAAQQPNTAIQLSPGTLFQHSTAQNSTAQHSAVQCSSTRAAQRLGRLDFAMAAQSSRAQLSPAKLELISLSAPHLLCLFDTTPTLATIFDRRSSPSPSPSSFIPRLLNTRTLVFYSCQSPLRSFPALPLRLLSIASSSSSSRACIRPSRNPPRR
ncbi:hypothetical protein PANT_25c00059 [Moesziomyces antarcticus T-34]|uniref:Uncharacterized protein n=1 Tax=Pseudozyma antarctica (strain T-34) TaxID=1151754 RepID=M9M0X3_PSEA3|nr:hypothetical protein PANT_25c00059 [Moesziomyces antarcticus T-34]